MRRAHRLPAPPPGDLVARHRRRRRRAQLLLLEPLDNWWTRATTGASGLVHVDYATHSSALKDSAHWYRDFRPLGLQQVPRCCADRRPGGTSTDGEVAIGGAPSSTTCRPSRPRHRDGVPELRALPAHDGGAEHVASGSGRWRGSRPRRDRRRRGDAPRSSQIEPLLERKPRELSAASASGWRHRPRHRAQTRCSCSTSRCPTWTRQAARADAHRDPKITKVLNSTMVYVTTTRSRR